MIKVPAGIKDYEIDLYIASFKFCEEKMQEEGADINNAIDQTISRFGAVFSDPEQLRSFLFQEITAYTEPAVALVADGLEDKDWWSKALEAGLKTDYWSRYESYLRRKPSWSLPAIMDIGTSTDTVMNCLANPCTATSLKRMGMVFGYVQSGKTAHYIGLINKAFDAGYRIIIVLTGIHNSLRSQTQSRIDEEVLGYETSLEALEDKSKERNAIGVGVGKSNQVREILQSITTRDEKGDMNKSTEGVSMQPPLLIVTKKNASVLRRILRYFKKSPIAETVNGSKVVPVQYPALIIDDEADQASINTNESYDEYGNMLEDYNPTTINSLIRQILQVFQKASYIGYTATPFANIFIPPHIETDKHGLDLFPRDFIVRAPRADNYIGAREFFGIRGDENTPSMPLCRDIIKGAAYLGKGTKSDDPVGDLPQELKTAIKYFLLSTALRNCRGQTNKPNTMLIHIVRFVAQQNVIKKKVKQYFDEEIANFIQYGDVSIHDELKSIWENDYLPTSAAMRVQFDKFMRDCDPVTWDEIWPEIQRIIRKKEILVYSVNGKSDDSLLYKKHEGKPFNVIVIGGDKLSRGLTLEGLTISYFTRSSNTYDTLMQMGRWFGFRPGYLDACRLFTTRTLKAYFSHISMATENLADQFDYMNDFADQTPMEFGLRVASHPDLEITARNKLRTGVEIKRDFSCKLSQTRMFDIDPEQYQRNFDAVDQFLRSIEGCKISKAQYEEQLKRKSPGDHLFWRGVSGHDVATFLETYETSRAATRANSKYMADYIRTMNQIGGVKSWTICLINIKGSHPGFSIAGYDIGAGISRPDEASAGDTLYSIRAMTSSGHEYFDYSAEDLKKANNLKNTLKGNSETCINEVIRKRTRGFENGLLLLYPIAEAGELTRRMKPGIPPFGFAVVFPDREGKGNLRTYRMNEIALEKDNDEFYN